MPSNRTRRTRQREFIRELRFGVAEYLITGSTDVFTNKFATLIIHDPDLQKKLWELYREEILQMTPRGTMPEVYWKFEAPYPRDKSMSEQQQLKKMRKCEYKPK